MAIIQGTPDSDELRGTTEDDVLFGYDNGERSDRLWGDAGNDILLGGPGGDSLYGDAGDDQLFGGDDNDFLIGGDGNDLLAPGAGAFESLRGGDGDDILLGVSGAGFLNGDLGNDLIIGGDGNEVIEGYGGRPQPGATEIDTLIGGGGYNLFSLGSYTLSKLGITYSVFYDDGDPTTVGTNDYALIVDFDPTKDSIWLPKTTYDLVLGSSPSGVPAGTGIYINKPGSEPDELIAVLSGISPGSLDMNASYFQDVQPSR